MAWLTGAVEGRAFLSEPFPRAIARGDPAQSCPATGRATGPEAAGGGREGTVRLALERCLGALENRRADCGCRLIAFNDILTVPRDEMAYATGITARLIAPERGIDAVLVAEDEAAPDGGSAGTLLRDLRGPVARLTRDGADGATLTLLADGSAIKGTRKAFGYRRGRLAERIRLDGGGLLLIGLSPAELAAVAERP
ncbi:MAG: hypothetical protein AAF183_03000 [Pseudomonadota bacterium]